jgi:hypothetical protein
MERGRCLGFAQQSLAWVEGAGPGRWPRQVTRDSGVLAWLWSDWPELTGDTQYLLIVLTLKTVGIGVSTVHRVLASAA